MSKRAINPIKAPRVQRFDSVEGLLAATREQCASQVDKFEALGRDSLWELQLGAKALKTVALLDKLVTDLERDQLADWIAGGGDEDGTRDTGEGYVYMSDSEIPAYVAARTLRTAVDQAKLVLKGKRERALGDYVQQFAWTMTDRYIALRALLEGYEPDLSGSTLEKLTINEVIQRVTNAVHAARKSLA